VTVIAVLFLVATGVAGKRADIVIADFEGIDFGSWSVQGKAFGDGPARGALIGQSTVSGNHGIGFVNGYHGGDESTGTLTSPEFEVTRSHISFLVGGGLHPSASVIEFLVDGRSVKSSTGRNGERFERRTWDVRKFIGRRAVIRVSDTARGGWGHINVDDIRLTDEPPVPAEKQFALWDEPWRPLYHFTPERNWLNDPNGLIFHEGEFHLFHQYNPEGPYPDHQAWNHAVSRDLIRWKLLGVALKEEDGVRIFSGSTVADVHNTSGFGPQNSPPLVSIYTGFRVSDGWQGQCLAYSTDRGRSWTKYDGNPVIPWEPEFRDPKVFWHKPSRKWVMIVVKADEKRARIYGSANLKNWTLLSTFGPAGIPADRKANWECPDLFPVPVEGEPGCVKWVLHVGMGGGHPNGGSGGEYFIGAFDGTTFQCDDPPGKVRILDYGHDNYAAVSWNGATGPAGERLWIGWMTDLRYCTDQPTHPWRGLLTIPRELSARRGAEDYHVIMKPAHQLQSLRGKDYLFSDVTLDAGKIFISGPESAGEALEIEATFRLCGAETTGIKVLVGEDCETIAGYDARRGEVFVDRSRSGRTDFNVGFSGRAVAPLPLVDGKVQLRVFVDRCSIEVFANGGERVISELVFPRPGGKGIQAFATGGRAVMESLRIWKLKRAQPQP